MKKLLLTAMIAAPLMAFHQAPNIDDKAANEAIQHRTGLMSTIKNTVISMRIIIGGNETQKDNLDELVTIFATTTSIAGGAFATDTRGAGTLETTAKDSIWSDNADFQARVAKFASDAKNLETVALGGDLQATRKAMMKALSNCKSCHDEYRTK